MTAVVRLSLSAAALAALLTLAGCAAATPETAAPETEAPTAEETAEAVAIETACPAGFVDAYAAASAGQFAEGVTFTEVAAAEFEPQFLAQFLDGGCAVHITGVSTFNGMEIPVDTDYGFRTENVSADVAAALEAEGFADDGSGVSFVSADGSFASVIVPTDDFHTNGDAAVQQYYKNGTVFTAG